MLQNYSCYLSDNKMVGNSQFQLFKILKYSDKMNTDWNIHRQLGVADFTLYAYFEFNLFYYN